MLIGFIFTPLGIANAFLIPLREFCDEQMKIREQEFVDENKLRLERRKERQVKRAANVSGVAGVNVPDAGDGAEGGDNEPLLS